MQSLTEKIIDSGQYNRVINEAQLQRLVDNSDTSRYGLVNRALKAGELHRIRRGLYVLDDKYRRVPVHPFGLAQELEPGSYVSLETALAHHGRYLLLSRFIPGFIRTCYLQHLPVIWMI